MPTIVSVTTIRSSPKLAEKSTVRHFDVSGDHERQKQVFERLKVSYDKQPYVIRRMLTEGAVRASDKRAQFVGLDPYVAAGGTVLRDLFQSDDGGWLQDVALVNRLVGEKLEREAEPIRAEDWKWIEVAPDFAYGHSYGLRQLRGETMQLTPDEHSAHDALQAEYDRLEETNAEADELSEEVDRRLAEIETVLAAFDERPMTFDPAEIVHSGAFVSIDGAGRLRVDRGYVRAEDETLVETEPDTATNDGQGTQALSETEIDGQPEPETRELEEDEALKPMPDRLMTELTAHRTLALRHALGEQPDVAFLTGLHALCVKALYRYALDSCLEIDLKSVGFGAQAPGLNDTALAASFHRRHQAWMAALPDEPTELWDALTAFETDSRQALFAHCVSLAVNAVFETNDRRPRALAHADRLAEALSLDMVAAGWSPTIENLPRPRHQGANSRSGKGGERRRSR
jgi:ParB family chromosome partitioning protein